MDIAAKLWEPSADRMSRSNMQGFMTEVRARWQVELPNYHSLYSWSVREPERFWASVWDYCKIIASKKWETVLESKEQMPGARWFTGARLNFAENLLRFNDDKPAIIFWGETKVRRALTYHELVSQVSKLAATLKNFGVKPGDRIAGFVPNMPETIIAALASHSCGAVWCSCSPDFGSSGILDRFGQIAPRVLVATDGYFFKGTRVDCLARIREIVPLLPTLERVIVIPYTEPTVDLNSIPHAVSFEECISNSAKEIRFEQLPPDHPLYIMFTSGTTGKPKCIVHGAAGTLLEHAKELLLHTDLKRSDVLFYQTTCGWMMWNWLISGLAAGATIILFDGSPLEHSGKILWDMTQQEGVTIFGTNAKYLALIEKEGLLPAQTHDLRALHTILSTGSPLLPESFDYVYRKVKQDVLLSSIAGGTDIIGCFMLGCPLLPVFRGEIQTRSLGLKVEIFNDKGAPVQEEKGELVCCAPFPSMPLGFWNDSAHGRYRSAYFERFPGVWHHGDFAELTAHGGIIMYGRSDAVLNPGGVRIGTAEIYRQVEKLPEVQESLAIGQLWDNDVRIVLFVVLKANILLSDELRDRIRSIVRAGASPFHVPKKIIAVADIPRTKSGKIVELAVREIVHGREPRNIEALANPEALQFFRNLPELST